VRGLTLKKAKKKKKKKKKKKRGGGAGWGEEWARGGKKGTKSIYFSNATKLNQNLGEEAKTL